MSTFKNDCPNGHGFMPLIKKTDTITYKGMTIPCTEECYRCPVCGLEASTVEQAAVIQEAVMAYQKSMARHGGRAFSGKTAAVAVAA